MHKLRFFFIVLGGGATLGLAMLLIGVAGVSEPLPAPQLEHLKTASAEQGKYLARAGNCAACHTAGEGASYAGGVEFQTPFGTLYSTNITPHPTAGIGDWDFAEFYRAMKQGVRPDGQHLYPAFPYTDFARFTDTDLASLCKRSANPI